MFLSFANPWALLGLAALPALAWLVGKTRWKKRAAARYSDIKALQTARPTWRTRWPRTAMMIRLLVLALLIIAMARPQLGVSQRNLQAEGIDIFLALDVSGSMKAGDFYPNRLEAAKRVLNNFVSGRESDRIGVIVFATTSFTLVPLTLDYSVIERFVEQVFFGIVDEDRTAIGLALANAAKKLQDSEAKSKVIVLLTDGENNSGNIEPELAAETARALGIRVYTIGVGAENRGLGAGGLLSAITVTGGGIDEVTLKKIASTTGGKYFRATDEKSLEMIFREIDEMETTEQEVSQHVNYSERMSWFVWPALLLALFEILLGYTALMKIP